MKRTERLKRKLAVAMATAMVLGLPACSSQSPATDNSASESAGMVAESSTATEEETGSTLVSEGFLELEYAGNFSVELFQDGYRMIQGGSLEEYAYLVVPEGKPVPEGLAENVKVLQQPLDRVYMASTGMVSLIDAIDALDHVELVATRQEKWYIDHVIAAMDAGTLAYSGEYSEPDYEMITDRGIQLHVGNTQLDDHPEVLEKFAELGIPSLVENSTKEDHPLGRVEWVKLFGVLFDKEPEAEAYFAEQKAMVESVTTEENSGKTVAMGYLTNDGRCYVRNGGDYMVEMIELAGGEYVLADLEPEKTGLTKMTYEEWYSSNKDAEYFFYVNMVRKFNSIQEMIEFDPLLVDFKSVQDGKVWVTSPDFTQSTSAIASIIEDMHTILFSEDDQVTTDHLVKLS